MSQPSPNRTFAFRNMSKEAADAFEDRAKAGREFLALSERIARERGCSGSDAAALAAEQDPALYARAQARPLDKPRPTAAQRDEHASERAAYLASFKRHLATRVGAEQAMALAAKEHPNALGIAPTTPAVKEQPAPVVVKLTRPTGTGTAAELEARKLALNTRVAELQAQITRATPASEGLPVGWSVRREEPWVVVHWDGSREVKEGEDPNPWRLYNGDHEARSQKFETREAAVAYAWAYVGPEAA